MLIEPGIGFGVQFAEFTDVQRALGYSVGEFPFDKMCARVPLGLAW